LVKETEMPDKTNMNCYRIFDRNPAMALRKAADWIEENKHLNIWHVVVSVPERHSEREETVVYMYQFVAPIVEA
jgi:hypothetical protein